MGKQSLRSLTFLLSLALAVLPASGATKKKTSTKRKSKPASTSSARAANAKKALAIPEVPEDGDLSLTADGAILLHGYSGRVMYEKSPDEKFYPASTTKIMTALLVIEAGDLDKEVEVTKEDSEVGESSLSIKPGDIFTRRQALYGLMLKSGNDIAHMLARDNAGSVTAFAEKMTRRAEELGALNTKFQNPHGLHHPEHYTTPRDLALITRAAMKQPFFRKVVSTINHSWFSPSTGPRELTNSNKLLRNFPGATGVKTGYTNPAQHTLASAALWGTDEMICVVMHATKQGKWDDSKLLITYGFTNLWNPEIPVDPTPATAAKQ